LKQNSSGSLVLDSFFNIYYISRTSRSFKWSLKILAREEETSEHPSTRKFFWQLIPAEYTNLLSPFPYFVRVRKDPYCIRKLHQKGKITTCAYICTADTGKCIF
jgi:hypothetical protein